MSTKITMSSALFAFAAAALCLPASAIPQVDANPTAVKYYNAGVKAYQASRYNDAANQYRKAIHIDPNFAEAHANLGLILEGSDRAAAIQQLRTATKLKPSLAAAHNTLGALLYQQKDYAGAANEYRSVIRLNPSSVPGHFNLGLALVKMGQLKGAIPEFRAAKRLDPRLADARLDLGQALYHTGDKKGARAEWQAVAQSGDPDSRKSARSMIARHR